MNSWLALLKREWLEHRGGFVWSHLGVLVVLTLFCLLLTFAGELDSADFEMQSSGSSSVTVEQALEHYLGGGSMSAEELGARARSARRMIAMPFVLVYFAVVFFVLLGALFDDRRDRTVLFWKSVPVSDAQTVVSKLLHAVWIAPLVTVVSILVAQLFALLLFGYLLSDNDGLGLGTLWQHADLLGGTVELLSSFFTQSFWSLPLWGWLLLVSAVVPRIPIIWTLLLPIAPMLLEWATFGSSQIATGISNHLRLQAFPSSATATGTADVLKLWLTPDMWLGIAVGAVFLFGAVYFRRRNNEL